MWATITRPFGWLMLQLYNWTNSYGLSVILFALIVNLILAPFMAKSKKGSMRMTRVQPKIQELQRRHEGNQQKLQQEMQKLYKEEGVNPMSGCIWSLIPFPILIALYSVIRQPLSRMLFISTEAVTALQNFFVENGWYTVPTKTDAYFEIKLVNVMHQHWAEVQQAISSGVLDSSLFTRLQDLNFTSFGINLGNQPNWKFWTFDFSDPKLWVPELILFLIPLISTFFSWLSMQISTKMNPVNDANTAAQMKSMNLMMPLMSLWFCFIMPASMGVYWIANSVFGIARDVLLTKYYKKQLDKEDAERIAARAQKEREIELNRLDTERKHLEGTSELNTNTSKKKLQANEKQKTNERKAALDKEEKAERRERLGIEKNAPSASQVGDRRYARGRAYDPDRYKVTDAVPTAEPVAGSVTEPVAEPVKESVAEPVQESVDNTNTENKEENK